MNDEEMNPEEQAQAEEDKALEEARRADEERQAKLDEAPAEDDRYHGGPIPRSSSRNATE